MAGQVGRWLLPAVAVALAVAYVPHLFAGEFVFEDRRWLGVDVQIGPRMLTQASWLLTSSPQAAHALSLALHVGVSALLGLFACRLGLSTLAGILTGALFVLHPLTVESVAYAASRSELIAALGILGACLACLRTDGWRWPLVVLSLAIGVGGKETAILALAFVPLTLWATGRAWAWPFAASGIALNGILAAYGTRQLLTIGAIPNVPLDPTGWILAQSAAAYRLLGLALVPHGMTVDADIDLYSQAARILAFAALIALGGFAWKLHKSKPLVAFGLAWTWLAILPRLFVQTPRSYLNEHQFYVPLMGLILAGMAWWDAPERRAWR